MTRTSVAPDGLSKSLWVQLGVTESGLMIDDPLELG